MYKKVGTIDHFEEIPFDRQVIISGGITRTDWVWRMPGIFRKDNDDFRFVNEFEMSTRFNRDVSISLNVLEKEQSWNTTDGTENQPSRARE